MKGEFNSKHYDNDGNDDDTIQHMIKTYNRTIYWKLGGRLPYSPGIENDRRKEINKEKLFIEQK